jgi:hypothetical protein
MLWTPVELLPQPPLGRSLVRAVTTRPYTITAVMTTAATKTTEKMKL